MSIRILLLLVVLTSGLFAQNIDSVYVRKLIKLEQKIDSLQKIILNIESKIQQVELNMSQDSEIDSLITAFTDEDMENIPEDQRSRRKRVDALLKIISEQPGKLRWNGDATASIQGNSQSDNRFATGVGSFDIFAHTSFGQNSLLFFDFEAIGGNGPNEYLSTFSSLNEDGGTTQGTGGFDRLRVLEAWSEFTVLNRTFTITMGKIDLTNYFDNNAFANDETSQFISGAFVNSAALPVPDNSPGIRFRTTILNRFFIQFGLASADNSGKDIFDELFKIASTGFKVLPDTDWEANIRLYGYQHPLANSAKGYGLSYDESIAGWFNIFGRYSQNETNLAKWSGISSAWSLGTQFVKTLAGNRAAIGIAYGSSNIETSGLENEKICEIYLQHQLNKWTFISPHFQWVWNAAGGTESLTLLGFRTHFIF